MCFSIINICQAILPDGDVIDGQATIQQTILTKSV